MTPTPEQLERARLLIDEWYGTTSSRVSLSTGEFDHLVELFATFLAFEYRRAIEDAAQWHDERAGDADAMFIRTGNREVIPIAGRHRRFAFAIRALAQDQGGAGNG